MKVFIVRVDGMNQVEVDHPGMEVLLNSIKVNPWLRVTQHGRTTLINTHHVISIEESK